MLKRVVITGLGVVAPNGVGIEEFERAIKNGVSGIRYFEELAEKKFSCCVGGQPEVSEEKMLEYFSPLQLRNFTSWGILYGVMAGMDAWQDAGLPIDATEVDEDAACIFGTGISGVEKMAEVTLKVNAGNVRRLGSTTVLQTMTSGVSAYLNANIGFGNQVTTNSSACTTGTESLIMAFDRIRLGKAKRVLVGGCSDHGPYIWGPFDAMKVMNFKSNEAPEKASRPMSATAAGFVPGSGAGAMVVESLESAMERGATIYAEVIGTAINSGGQRNGGTMTAPNATAVQRCIRTAVKEAGVESKEIDLINGHLTATVKDPMEVENWALALERNGKDFPYIHSLKSMIGHCIGAAGSIECVSAILAIKGDYVFPSINCEDLHPQINEIVAKERIPSALVEQAGINIVAKAGFGFGDVNACVLFKKYNKE